MFRRSFASVVVLCSAAFAQQGPSASRVSQTLEFPVKLQQNVVAGNTPAGTHVQAKLVMATLVDGVVIPDGAVFSGEVTESVAKSDSSPSRLSLRMDSAQWKGGSKDIKLYLTAWYYPLRSELRSQDNSGAPGTHGEVEVTFGQSNVTGPPSAVTTNEPHPFPENLPDPPSSEVSTHRILLKDVDAAAKEDGTVEISSTHRNLKLDKNTTYVLAAGTLVPTR